VSAMCPERACDVVWWGGCVAVGACGWRVAAVGVVAGLRRGRRARLGVLVVTVLP
jgi:hypothetical protein